MILDIIIAYEVGIIIGLVLVLTIKNLHKSHSHPID